MTPGSSHLGKKERREGVESMAEIGDEVGGD